MYFTLNSIQNNFSASRFNDWMMLLFALISLIVFTAIYGILAVVEMKLLLAAAQQGIDETKAISEENSEKLAVAY